MCVCVCVAVTVAVTVAVAMFSQNVLATTAIMCGQPITNCQPNGYACDYQILSKMHNEAYLPAMVKCERNHFLTHDNYMTMMLHNQERCLCICLS